MIRMFLIDHSHARTIVAKGLTTILLLAAQLRQCDLLFAAEVHVSSDPEEALAAGSERPW